mmetsp:Transcript_9268/g.28557  ORF Transcript_9268/g.28557 Transcript_9268/m.28557 type:complete len:607 (+) Transcript_9268:607-2427(+)
MQAQKGLQYPKWFLASNNYLREKWRWKTVRRLKNIILMLEWAPGAPSITEGVPMQQALQAALRACELDGAHQSLEEHQAKGLLECLHLSTAGPPMASVPGDLASISYMLERSAPVCPSQPGRYFCLVSLFEAEHLRALLHARPAFRLGIALRAPTVFEGQALDTSADFVAGPAYQVFAAEHLCRFANSEASFNARELCAVDLCLANSSHDERHAWWEQVKRCRRRPQGRPVPTLPVAALLIPPEVRHKARLDSAVAKVKATLRRRRMSARQLFGQRAGRGGLYLSTADLTELLQTLGLSDPIEAGRLALAASRLGGGEHAGVAGDFMNWGGGPATVSLAGFLKLMGSVPIAGGELEDEEAAAIEIPTSPGECTQETAMKLDAGRWSMRLVAHTKFAPVWSSVRVPGHEARPFCIWRAEVRETGLQKGFRNLTGMKSSVKQFVLGDIGVRGLDAPARGLVLQIKAAQNPPRGKGLNLSLDGWIARFLPRPVAYRLVWHDRRGITSKGGADAGEGLYVWRPVPPSEAFVAVGAVCTTDPAEPRGVEVRCVPKTWLVRGDTLGPALWSLGERQEVRVQDSLMGVIAVPTDNLRYVPSWSFMADRFYTGT